VSLVFNFGVFYALLSSRYDNKHDAAAAADVFVLCISYQFDNAHRGQDTATIARQKSSVVVRHSFNMASSHSVR